MIKFAIMLYTYFIQTFCPDFYLHEMIIPRQTFNLFCSHLKIHYFFLVIHQKFSFTTADANAFYNNQYIFNIILNICGKKYI